MFLFKKFLKLLKASTKPEHPISKTTSGIDHAKRIASLIEQANRYYPQENPAKALELFLEVIALASPAPVDHSSQKDRDVDDIGFAVWAGWVCMDMLDKSSEEIEEYLKRVQSISPVTVERIRERLAAHQEEQKNQDSIDNALETVDLAQSASDQSLKEALLIIRTIAMRDGAWWLLRDTGIRLAKRGYNDHAWSFFNTSLQVAMQQNGNLPSIYAAMGDLLKAEGKYYDAARQYILSIKSSSNEPLKKAVNQLRICLKKAGASADAEKIRDILLEKISALDSSSLLSELDSMLKAAGNQEKKKEHT